MTKIMLVEDDKSLREIYGVRLLAEGYDIVSAGDGEEALAVAIKERPGLIISDVMMPKISGFDMLDILRSTTETRNVKVIMMTALSSDEQRARGEQLGADRYLVKSQVGIEDVVRVVHEVLGDAPGFAAAQAVPPVGSASPTAPLNTGSAAPEPRQTTSTTAAPITSPEPNGLSTPSAAPQSPPATSADGPASASVSSPSSSVEPAAPPQSPSEPSATPQPSPPPTVSDIPRHSASIGNPTAPSSRSKVIAPLNDPFASKVNINELFDKEMAKETSTPAADEAAGAPTASPTSDANAAPAAQTGVNNSAATQTQAAEPTGPEPVSTDQERTVVNNQIDAFAHQPSPRQDRAVGETLNGDLAGQSTTTQPATESAAATTPTSTQTAPNTDGVLPPAQNPSSLPGGLAPSTETTPLNPTAPPPSGSNPERPQPSVPPRPPVAL